MCGYYARLVHVTAGKSEHIRDLDECGGEYLYPSSHVVSVERTDEAERVLLRTS
jgi:hypothetical protein